MSQRLLFDHGHECFGEVRPFHRQLLKWIGNKQRFAHEIVSYFPRQFGTYFEPFLGAGGVLGTLVPPRAIASDAFPPLVEIWKALRQEPDMLKMWYAVRWQETMAGDKVAAYEKIKSSYNSSPNGPDLLFLCRACYGGVVRFRKADGYMSTPCGVHLPIRPEAFAKRVDQWRVRTTGAEFKLMDFSEAMPLAKSGDLVYCDPPYTHTQSILYGSQSFALKKLFAAISECKSRGVYVALSIDGTKKSGDIECDLPIPAGLFHREVRVNCGRSMLRRFQLNGHSLEHEVVADRLLLTY